ncbi:NAD-dependent epimerase/dehydratase family protein [Catenulispora sp. NF23]|uniref:NAD-dependent epimerase/dehydratase family protein n=1 Tax=Catenulispora pinistramenti TaxID=2705254 RepID=A0ABS5KXG6_9ACTN|nr:NAD-dependent epimerase/dehydratase family protein [Catenulispora pinistramenti]MBS2534822.1 NAD-dependent epimerase/dehydratase family protein [Catenulispora pinistramenti]MBS2550705.1 NAD-dependent epimerase/dehydratase family protein [Catenulispora pinistramenti]
MRTVVTGGCGFIGSHVVDKLVDAGHEVVVVDSTIRKLNPAAEYRQADILDLAQLTKALDGGEAVFHLAAAADVNEVTADPVRALRLNVEGTGNALEAARQTGMNRFVLASTVWVYGAAASEGEGADAELTEDVPFDLRRSGHLYVATKLAAEMAVQSYRELYGQHFTILRYGIPYGPRMRDALVVAKFVQAALNGQPITIAGEGEQTRNYVYVQDLAAAHVLALSPTAEDETIALEGTTPISVRQIADTVDGLLGPITLEQVPARAGDYAGTRISNAKAKRLLGWSPTTGFTEGVRRYVEWLRASQERRVG